MIFIHRTAIEFLRQSQQGKIFLEENAKSCSSPRPTYIRALLAKVTLLGFPEKPSSPDVELDPEANGYPTDDHCDDFSDKVACLFVSNIIHHIALEEYNTMTAQVKLCSDVDRILATLFQRHRVMSPFPHWCSRWRMVVPEGDEPALIAQRPKMGSPPSSAVSFSSARRESLPFSDSPANYLGFAASWGLSRYVLAIYDLEQHHLDHEYTNYLLCCSIRALYRERKWVPRGEWVLAPLHLIAELLSRGGNPNMYGKGFSNTIWGQFLVSLRLWKSLVPPGARDIQIASTMTAKAFLKAGADPHMKYLRRIFVFGLLQSLASRNTGGRLEVCLYSEESTLYIVRRLLEYLPEWKTVEEIILAKGGRESYKYTHVTVYTHIDRLYKLSERQHERLVTALNVAHHDCLKQCNLQSWGSLQTTICNEHLASALDSEDQVSSDIDASSGSDGEEEFFESLETQTVADV